MSWHSCDSILKVEYAGNPHVFGLVLRYITLCPLLNTQIEETSREREERLKGWEAFLGDPNTPASEGPGVKLPESVQPSKGNSASEGSPKDQATKREDNEGSANDDAAASTDSSIAGSDEEAET